jgi:enediyne biosynthesis protein E5
MAHDFAWKSLRENKMDNKLDTKNQMNDAARRRIGGLRRFGIAITVLNLLGHFFFGFEQSYAQPVVALLTAYSLEILLELTAAKVVDRSYKFKGGLMRFIDFLLPAHITGLAVSMLIYANDRLWVVCFATAVAIASKILFQLPVGKGPRHFFNPSNFGITITLLLFSWVGISPPYQFTENLDGYSDWILPAIIICSGTLLNFLFTQRLPLIAAWLSGFALQAIIRNLIFDTQLTAALLPMTGVAFILYTFYMVTDPATTPNSTSGQLVFGFGNAFIYGLLMTLHIVFGLFFALTITCVLRGLIINAEAWFANRVPVTTAEKVSGVEIAPV